MPPLTRQQTLESSSSMQRFTVDGMPVTVRPAKVEEIIGLRHAVLRVGYPLESAKFPSDAQLTSFHAGAFSDQNDCIGCATLHLEPFETEAAYRLRGMAIDPNYRRLGLGSAVLKCIEKYALDQNVHLLWCNARTPAVGFYQKHGWQIISNEFDIPTVGPHFNMFKRI